MALPVRAQNFSITLTHRRVVGLSQRTISKIEIGVADASKTQPRHHTTQKTMNEIVRHDHGRSAILPPPVTDRPAPHRRARLPPD